MIRILRAAALAGVSLIAMAVHAHADPVSIGSFVISSLLSTGLGAVLPVVSAAAIGNFVIGAAVIAANIAVSALGAQRPPVNPSEFKNVFEDTSNQSELRAVGRVRVGGLKAFGNTAGLDRFRLICHTKGLWTATEEHYLGGREVTVEGNGDVSSPPWARPGQASWVNVQTKLGTGGETAWPDLISAFPTLWTSAHRVRGIHQSLVKYISPGLTDEKFLKLYQGGEPPYEKVGRAEPVYDPRAGGQSATNPATWAWRDNGILCAAHILRAFPSVSASDLDYADIALESTKADAQVATRAGLEDRSRCWGFWPSESQRSDIMEQVLRSVGAEILQTSDDKTTIRMIDDVRTPDITIPEKHIVDLQWRAGPESIERVNVCRVRYYSPERHFEMTEIDLTGIAWARVQEEIDRVGEQYYDVELPFCPSAPQAQRIARRLFALARADAGVVKTNFAGMAAWGKPVAAIEFPDLGITETCAIGTPRVNDDEGTVEIPFVVWPDLTPWNPAVDEAPAPEPLPNLQYESELDQPAPPSEAAVVQYESGTYETRVKFSGVPGGTIAEANYRTYSGGEPNAFQSMNEYGGTSIWYGWATANTAGGRVDFRSRFFNADDEGSYFSNLLTINQMAIDNTPTGAPAVVATGLETGVDLTITVPELRAVSLRVEYNWTGTWTTHTTNNAVRPASPIHVVMDGFLNSTPSDRTLQWRVSSATSNGTQGAYASGSVLIPGNPP